mmetsp:Transcript_14687/g.23996  ORF Transcript_14687/g.23996 Transcript_14687/m.23996 type:complete len:236 (+) Transcript_14687:188-895(+)
MTFAGFPVNNETSVFISQSPVIFTSYDFPPSFPITCSVYSTSDRYLAPIIFCFRPPNRVKPPASPLNPSLYFIVDELEYNNSQSPTNSSLLTAPPPTVTTLLYGSLSSSPTTSNTRSCSNSLQSNPHSRRPSSSPILSRSSNSSNNSTFNSLKSSSCCFCCCAGSLLAVSSSTSSNKSSIASANLQNPSSSKKVSVPGAFSTRPTNTSSSSCDKSPSDIISCNSPQRFNSACPTK